MEDVDKSCKMLSSDHNLAVIHMNSHQLWLLAQDQANQHSSTNGGEDPKVFPLVGSCWQLMAADGRESIFPKFGHCDVTRAPVDDETTMCIQY